MQNQQLLSTDNVLESVSFSHENGAITVPFGVKEDGTLLVDNIAWIPHILITGCTGSGKTSFVQTLLMILANEYSTDEVRFAIFDAKGVDYTFADDLPHLLRSVGTHREVDFVKFLSWLNAEIKSRYDRFSRSLVQDILSYNQRNPSDSLPHFFVVVDDMVSFHFSQETIEYMSRIIGIARKAGVHFIIVSSALSGKEMSKEILSAIPCRVAFRSATRAESKAAIDMYGAELLSIPGEMIYRYSATLSKMHAVFMPYDEVCKVANDLKYKAVSSIGGLNRILDRLSEQLKRTEKVVEDDSFEDERDPLFLDALEICIEAGAASTSMLQRKLRIGYARCARIVDELEQAGYVSSQEGAKPRRVLVTREELFGNNSRGAETLGSQNEREDTTPVDRLQFYESKSNNAPDDDDDIILRRFPHTSVEGGSFSVYRNKVHLKKRINTKRGSGTAESQFDGGAIKSIVFKRATMLSRGYFSFSFTATTNWKFTGENNVAGINQNNFVEKVIKTEVSLKDNRVVDMFLTQLSEDTKLEITYV